MIVLIKKGESAFFRMYTSGKMGGSVKKHAKEGLGEVKNCLQLGLFLITHFVNWFSRRRGGRNKEIKKIA